MFIISLQFFPPVQGFILRYRGTSVYAALAWLLIQPSCKVPTVKRIKNFSLVAINSTFSPNFSHRTFPNKNARQGCARARVCARVFIYIYTHTHIYMYIDLNIYVYVMSHDCKVLVMSSLPEAVLRINIQYDRRTAACLILDLCRS